MKRALIFLLLILAACAAPQQGVNSMTDFLTASDGTKIAYNYVDGQPGKPGVVLVHMLPSNKESWESLIPVLESNGYSIIAIDYRGRGESEGQLETPEDFQNITLDVNAAVEFLVEEGITTIGIIGGSIGANHALLAAAKNERIKAAVLLSPGLDYRGVKTGDIAASFAKPLLVVASNDDEYSAESAKTIHESAKGTKELKMYDDAGHATRMFVKEDLIPKIVDWLNTNMS